MSDNSPFKIDIGGLRSRPKPNDATSVAAADAVASDHGFVAREGRGKRGRQPSPRTGQVHAKVYPGIADEIANEARRRGVTQGVIIEEAWNLYKLR